MLGRLEMEVDECIDAYTSMFKTIFEKKKIPITWSGKLKGRFDSEVLEQVIQKMVTDRKLPVTEPFDDGKDRNCKTCVVISLQNPTSDIYVALFVLPHSRTRLLLSYEPTNQIMTSMTTL